MASTRLYLLIEETARELASRLLIANFALEQGFEVILAPQWAVWENLQDLQPGIVLFKGNNGAQSLRMRRAKAAGHLVVSLEEEAFGVSDRREIVRLYEPGIGAVCDLFLTQGLFHARCLAERFPEIVSRIRTTGNPRSDLLSATLSAPLRQEGRRLREIHGKFVLLNTNFGSINPRRGDAVDYFESCVRLGIIDPNNAEDMGDLLTWCDWVRTNLSALMELIGRLVSEGFPWRVVVRPHPSENIDIWQRNFAGIDGVEVIREGDHHAWTLAAQLLLHTSSTTGLEAFLLGVPAITLCAGDNRWHQLYTANLVNQVDTSAAAAADTLFRFANQSRISDTRSALGETAGSCFKDQLVDHLQVDGNRFAAEHIVEALVDLREQGAGRLERSTGKEQIWVVNLPDSKIDPGQFALSAVAARLESLRVLLNRTEPIDVGFLGPEMIRLTLDQVGSV